jgi:hypothetical protein
MEVPDPMAERTPVGGAGALPSRQAMTVGGNGAGHDKCSTEKRGGGRCTQAAGWGTDHPGIGACKLHGGCTPNHRRAAGIVRVEREATRQLRDGRSRRSDPGAENVPEFVEQLRVLVARAVQAAAPTSVMLLLPLQWQLAEALGLSFLGGGMSPPEEWGLSDSAAHDFAGVFERAAAFHFPEVPNDVLFIVDLSRYVVAEAWQPNDENVVTVTVPSENEARERAQRDPGKEEIGEDEIVRRWRETALVTVDPEQVRLLKPITLHEARHSAASYLIEAGLNDQELTGMIGHSDPRTTKAIYGHLFPDSREKVAAKLDAYLELASG